MGKLFVIHFNPIELYPPVQNFLNFAAGKSPHILYVLTTHQSKQELPEFISPSENIRIVRLGKTGKNLGAMSRYISYLRFYLGSILQMLLKRPARILYYETLSAFPAFMYKKLFQPAIPVFIHYHEYSSPEELKRATSMMKFFHRLELKLYPLAAWVSQTNQYRMDRFVEDIRPVRVSNKRILPNYPPLSWHHTANLNPHRPLRIVYVGALSLHTMFTRQFAEWVIAQNGMVTWDIYSYNIKHDAKLYLHGLHTPNVRLKPSVEYAALPGLLKQYDVGVILYTGHIPNYIFNAPNKLFEYLACGLDVWFPDVMKGSLPYVTTDEYPKVLAIDFNNMDNFEMESALFKEGLQLKRNDFFCETALEPLQEAFLNVKGVNAQQN